jgi:hypothetical protein
VLLIPDLQAADECWEAVLPRLAEQLHGDAAVTLGIALPVDQLGTTPKPVEELPGTLSLDVLLTEQPATTAGWDALLRGANLLVLTGRRPELADAAGRSGVAVLDALSDPHLRPAPAASA